MPFATNNGVRIYFELEGSGPPLVLAHGISGSLEDWREFGWVDELKDRYQLILVDARGHGRSDKPHEPDAYRLPHQAMDHIAVLDSVGIEGTHFMGFSMGGLVSLAAAIYTPERCKLFMMGGTQPYARDERLLKTGLPIPKPLEGMPDADNPVDELLASGGEDWVAFFEANMAVSPEMKKRLIENDYVAVRARFAAIYERDLSRHLHSAQMPGLIYMGEEEPSYGGAKQLAEQLPNAEFVAFPGLNHFDMLTQIELVLPVILRFLSQSN